MGTLFRAYNAAMPTTAAITPVTTGTAIKTMLQVATPSTIAATIVAWGVSFDGTATAAPVKCELVETDVAATVTAHVAAGLHKVNLGGASIPSLMTLSTTATGYTATAEGTTTASRLFDYHLVSPMNEYAWEFSLGREPVIQPSKFLRVRVTAAVAYNCVCWVMWEE